MAGKPMNAIDVHVAMRLKLARIAAQMSQETAAAASDLTFQQIQKYESGRNRVSAGRLAQLAELYAKPIAWFFEGAPNATGTSPGVIDVSEHMMLLPGGPQLAGYFSAIADESRRKAVVCVARTFAECTK